MLATSQISNFLSPQGGRPPQIDLEAVLNANHIRQPGQLPWLCGGFFAAFATTFFFGAGQPTEAMMPVILLAFSIGMCGGWIIRQAGESAYQSALNKEAWSHYHLRRAGEFG